MPIGQIYYVLRVTAGAVIAGRVFYERQEMFGERKEESKMPVKKILGAKLKIVAIVLFIIAGILLLITFALGFFVPLFIVALIPLAIGIGIFIGGRRLWTSNARANNAAGS